MIKRNTLLALAALVATAAPVAAAQASTVFDFESLSTGNYSTISQTVGGLTATFYATTGTLDLQSTPFTGFGSVSLLNYFAGTGPTVANFSSAVTGVSITGDDYTPSDVDNVYLAAYSGLDLTGVFLGSITGADCCVNPGDPPETVSLPFAGIRSIAFYTASGAAYPGALYFDNLTVDNFVSTGGGVPEPASWALMLTGFFGLGSALRRRRAQPVLSLG